MRVIVVGINEPSTWCLCTKFVQHALASIPCFRIWGHFLPFHVLGFGVIFRHSAIPPFQLLGSPLLKRAKGLTRGIQDIQNCSLVTVIKMNMFDKRKRNQLTHPKQRYYSKDKIPHVRWVVDLQSQLFVWKDHCVISLYGL